MKWVICDMDGTVVDSMGPLSKLGIHLISLVSRMGQTNAWHAYHDTAGMPFLEQVRIAFGYCGLSDECAEAYSDIHKLMAPAFKLTPFGEALRTVGDHIGLGLVSSTSEHIIKCMPVLQTIPWKAIRGYNGESLKLMQITEIMNVFALTREDVVYVGDLESDRTIARSLDIRFSWPDIDLLAQLTHESLANLR